MEPKEATNIIVYGDPIIDVYYKGDVNISKFTQYHRHNTESVHTRDGGAANVLYNIEIMTEDLTEVYISSCMPKIILLKLNRVEINGNYIEFWQNNINSKNYYSKENYQTSTVPTHDHHLEKVVLVLSDYNKGMCNREDMAIYDSENPYGYIEPDVIIADSKHRTLHKSFLHEDAFKIWHCTGDEYDYEWSKNFDFVYRTNGPNDVWLGYTKENPVRKNQIDWVRLEVPRTPITDTIGAGDTFTAAIAAYIAREISNRREIDFKCLIAAGEYAISCCQEVIQHKFNYAPGINILKDF